ncbi:hypothetical protein BN946_scf184970.g88 [Trametes cinnabarina]|uniref:Cytochrome P450 n=1 Tax=Pycnoporus cinnabarinus TaxID=5643 RepID=A0A060SDE0_PYCCI|nr:hypothetical protein BN946_scf184970.g88 [Trametes cinnabarina]
MYREFAGKRREWTHHLHLRYGPIVRIAPNEVSFASREAVKEIYTSGGSGFDKARFYTLFENFDLPDAEDLKMMKELSYSSSLRKQYFQHYYPRLAKVLDKIASLRGRRAVGLTPRYVLDTARDAAVSPHTVLHKLRTYEPEGSDYKAAASECMDHLVAGIDTTGDGLCFLMHQLSLPASQHVQERLHAELAANSAASLDDLPYLDAVVKEGLRIFSPIPMSFPRVVPAGGKVVDGVWLPGGTIVSCQPHTLHRLDESVFPLPEEFRPERWLQEEGAAERNQLFFAFSAGGRGCIGKK